MHLRALEESDLNPTYLQWLNDEEVCRFNSHATFPNTARKMKAYFSSVQNTQRDVVLAIADSSSGRHIGNVSLQNINWVSHNAEFAFFLGDKNYWGGGYGTEASQLIVEYGFR